MPSAYILVAEPHPCDMAIRLMERESYQRYHKMACRLRYCESGIRRHFRSVLRLMAWARKPMNALTYDLKSAYQILEANDEVNNGLFSLVQPVAEHPQCPLSFVDPRRAETSIYQQPTEGLPFYLHCCSRNSPSSLFGASSPFPDMLNPLGTFYLHGRALAVFNLASSLFLSF